MVSLAGCAYYSVEKFTLTLSCRVNTNARTSSIIPFLAWKFKVFGISTNPNNNMATATAKKVFDKVVFACI